MMSFSQVFFFFSFLVCLRFFGESLQGFSSFCGVSQEQGSFGASEGEDPSFYGINKGSGFRV